MTIKNSRAHSSVVSIKRGTITIPQKTLERFSSDNCHFVLIFVEPVVILPAQMSDEMDVG